MTNNRELLMGEEFIIIENWYQYLILLNYKRRS
jgi:hypothetical protein